MRNSLRILSFICLVALGAGAPLYGQACPAGSCPFGLTECDLDGDPCTLDCIFFGTCTDFDDFCANSCDDGDPCTGGVQMCNLTDGSCEGGTELCCADTLDNDEDGNADCSDADCVGGVESDCANGLDDNCNGLTDCADPTCLGGTETACGDGLDNDCDGLVDCEDADCVGLPCDDGFSCTGGEVCMFGSCMPSFFDDSVCDDGQFCNGAEICDPSDPTANAEGCTDAPDPCDRPGVGCDETGDECIELLCSDGFDNDGDLLLDCLDPDCPCEPGNRCTSGGRCAEDDCLDGIDNDRDGFLDCEDMDCTTRPCDDGFACTVGDACAISGLCEGTPEDSICDNALYCDGEETCEPEAPGANALGCLDGEEPCPGAGVGCDEATRSCEEGDCTDGRDNDGDGWIDCEDPDCDAQTCDDGVSCTSGDVCEDFTCTGVPNDGLCDDSFGCTIDSCDPASGCVYDKRDELCDDTLFCNGVEICDPENPNHDIDGCVDTADPCGPGLVCDELNDECDEEDCTDSVDNDRDGDIDCLDMEDCPCAPGSVCRAIDGKCHETDCADGTDNDDDGLLDCEDPDCDLLPCDDGASCSSGDTCAAGLCIGAPDDTVCDNALFCDGAEACDPLNPDSNALGCRPGRLPCPDPGAGCDDEADVCFEEDCADARDNDFDGPIDCADRECATRDRDGDGFVAAPCGEDCDDSNGQVYPGRTEDCNTPEDDNCDGILNCDDPACTLDRDRDGHIAAPCGDDCDDTNPEIHPGRVEDCRNAIDDDCDDLIDCLDDVCENRSCNDGVFCTHTDLCMAGECVGTRDHTRCEDGLFCNGEELCDPDDPDADLRGCIHPGDPCEPPLVCEEITDECIDPEGCDLDEYEDDDGCTDVRSVTVTSTPLLEQHSLCPEDDVDRVAFDVQAGYQYLVFTTGELDTQGSLTDAACSTTIATNDDCSPGDLNFCIMRTATEDSTVVISVRSSSKAPDEPVEYSGDETMGVLREWVRNGVPTQKTLDLLRGRPGSNLPDIQMVAIGDYHLWFVRSGLGCLEDAWEPDGMCHTATFLQPEFETIKRQKHSICPGQDVDFFEFEAEAGTVYQFRSEGNVDMAGAITPDDCSKFLLKSDRCNLEDENFCLEWRARETGTYKLGVTGDQEGGPYDLLYSKSTERLKTCEEDLAEEDDDCLTGTLIAPTPSEQTLGRSICGEGDMDHFTFNGEAGVRYRFYSTGATDTIGNVRDSDCEHLVGNDDCRLPTNMNFCLEFRPKVTGVYHLRVRGHKLDQTIGNYILHYEVVP